MFATIILQALTVNITPEVQGIILNLLTVAVGFWVGFVKILPGILERREKLWEESQQSKLADAENERQEDIDQREANRRFQESQIKVSEAQIALLSNLIETNSGFIAKLDEANKTNLITAQAASATAKALTDNTIELSVNSETMKEFTHKFLEAFNKGSEPVQHIYTTVEEMRLNGIKPDEAARQQLTRIETAVNEINDKVLPCVETKTTMDQEMVAVLSEARRLIELFNRDAQLKIEDKRKTDSKPIKPITVDATDKQEGSEGSAAA